MRHVYLDHLAKTPVLPQVREAMKISDEEFGNPSSLHRLGRKSAKALEEAREKVASLIGAASDEIIFTSCGTESNHLVIQGLAAAHEKKGKHLVLSGIEHFSVLYTARRLERQGYRVTHLSVDRQGLVDPAKVLEAIAPETVLVSVQAASAEIGTIQSIAEIGKIAKSRGVLFHTDAVASCGVIPIDVSKLSVDALSCSANTFYGPVGVAALFLRKGTKMIPFLDGGGQEEGRRSGTENLPAIVGMGEAAEAARLEMAKREHPLLKLQHQLIEKIVQVEGVTLTGHPTLRLPGHVSVTVEGIEGESLLLALDMNGISVGNGSACNSKAMKSSHVLRAMGIPEKEGRGALVFSLGIGNTEEDIAYVSEIFPKNVAQLRRMGAKRQEVGVS